MLCWENDFGYLVMGLMDSVRRLLWLSSAKRNGWDFFGDGSGGVALSQGVVLQ